MKRLAWFIALAMQCTGATAHEVSADDWVRTGERVHGGYGSLIAPGVRIGLKARLRLSAEPRDFDVTYLDGAATPCACVVDGILVATAAGPGQGSLRVAAERAQADAFGVVPIRHRKTGAGLRFTNPYSAFAALGTINRDFDALGRHLAVMQAPAERWYRVERLLN